MFNDKVREESLKKAIALYESIIEIYRKDNFREKYAEVQNKIGVAYYRLLEIYNTVEYRNKALNSLNEASRLYTIDSQKYGEVISNIGLVLKRTAKTNRKDLEESIKCFETCDKIFKNNDNYLYGKNLKDLGEAYRKLFEIDSKEIYAEKAIFYGNRASIVFNINEYPFDFADCQDNLGIAYRKLSDLKERKTNLEKAISHYLQAKNLLIDKRPVDYASTCNNLGIIYSRLAQICNSEENSSKAIELYNEAINILTKKKYPIQYARFKHNLGLIYRRLAKIKEYEKNLNESINNFNYALEIRTENEFKFSYANTQRELSFAYIKLSKIKNKLTNLKEAEIRLNESKIIVDDGEHKVDLSECLSFFGYLYYEFWKINNKKYYIKQGINYVNESINIRKDEVNQYQYAMNQLQLGRMDRELSSIEDPIVNLERSNEALNNAMQIFSNEECQYYISKTNFYKGVTFYQMAENHLENKGDLLNKSLDHYSMALKTIRNGEYPLFCAKVKFHMANSYAKLDNEPAIQKSRELYQEVFAILKKENVDENSVDCGLI